MAPERIHGTIPEEERTPVHTFLENVITRNVIEQTINDTCNRICVLCEDTENDRDEGESQLLDFAEEIPEHAAGDHALTFFKRGGVHCINAAMKHPSNAVRAAYVGLIGDLAQNNEPVQNFLFAETSYLAQFLDLLKNEHLPAPYQCKLLGAVSSMVRGNPVPKRAFLDKHAGIETLKAVFDRAFDEDEYRVAGRASLVLCNIYLDTLGGHENLTVKQKKADKKHIGSVVEAVYASMQEKADLYEEHIQYYNDHRQ
uniref:Armadillo/beta-catenin-like repeat-containing protein n=1 Tax=Panagrellus redivivus TaxID=6233 RepID=A0A7E4VD40_PANRE